MHEERVSEQEPVPPKTFEGLTTPLVNLSLHLARLDHKLQKLTLDRGAVVEVDIHLAGSGTVPVPLDAEDLYTCVHKQRQRIWDEMAGIVKELYGLLDAIKDTHMEVGLGPQKEEGS